MRRIATIPFYVPAMLAVLMSGCNPAAAPQQATSAKQVEVSPNAALCEALTTASDSGDTSLRAAFVSTPEGRDYGGGVIRELTDAGKYRFTGAEMVGKTCYAHAEAHGQQWGKTFDLMWRCPVKVLSDNVAEAGKTVLEVVEDRQCDFDTVRGAPAKRDVTVDLIHR